MLHEIISNVSITISIYSTQITQKLFNFPPKQQNTYVVSSYLPPITHTPAQSSRLFFFLSLIHSLYLGASYRSSWSLLAYFDLPVINFSLSWLKKNRHTTTPRPHQHRFIKRFTKRILIHLCFLYFVSFVRHVCLRFYLIALFGTD